MTSPAADAPTTGEGHAHSLAAWVALHLPLGTFAVVLEAMLRQHQLPALTLEETSEVAPVFLAAPSVSETIPFRRFDLMISS